MIHSLIKSSLELTWPTLVIVLSIVIILRITLITKSEKKFVLYEEIFNLLFVAYILILFELVTYSEDAVGGFNLVPFKEIMRYDFGTSGFYKQVLGNIILFIPFGYFASKYCRIKKIGGIALITLLSSSIIEIVQYFIGRSFDIDDIILNVIGGIVGFLVYICINAIERHLPELLKKDSVKNFIFIIILIFVALYMLGIL